MKKFILLFLLIPFLLGAGPRVTVDGNPQVTGDATFYDKILRWNQGITSEVVTATTEDFTLYVRTTGSDSNDCLSTGAACLTIPEALTRIPKKIDHTIAIDIGAGNFDGFDIENFNISRTGLLSLTGTLGNVSPASGTATGTADGGSTTQCVDSGQTWTVNDLRGSFVYVNSEYRIVRSNTADTMELIGPLGASCSGKAYVIQEPTTVINGYGALGFARVSVGSNTGARDTISLTNLFISGGVLGLMTWYTNMPNLERIICDAQSTTGFMFQDVVGGRGKFKDCVARDGAIGIDIQRHWGTFYGPGYTERLFAVNNSGAGFQIKYNMGTIIASYWYSDDNNIGFTATTDYSLEFKNSTTAYSNTSHGFSFTNVYTLNVSSIVSDSNGGYGVNLDSASGRGFTFFNGAGNLTISNNTSGGIIGNNHSTFSISNCDGTGNGTYGLTLEYGSAAKITSDTDLTGISGDATINAGTTALVWATDFNDNGDIVVNLDNGCRIERKD